MKQECVTSADRAASWPAAFDRLVKKTGRSGAAKLGEIVGRSRAATRKWRAKGVPWEHIALLEEALGVPGYEINPIVYPKEKILRWAEQILAEDVNHGART